MDIIPTVGNYGMNLRQESDLPSKSQSRKRRRRNSKIDWSALNNELWLKVIRNMDVIQLFATMMTSNRLCQLVSGDEVAWRRAGASCLPLSWHAVTMPGARFDVLSLEAKIFLKYVVLHERCCAQALLSPDFKPYCLRSTGVSLSDLSRSLPSARFTLDGPLASETLQHEQTIPSTRIPPSDKQLGTSSSQPDDLALSSSLPQLVSPEPSISAEESATNTTRAGDAQVNDALNEIEEAPSGGELPDPDSQDFIMTDAVPTSKKPRGMLRRSLNKLKHVAHIFQKSSKPHPKPGDDTKAVSDRNRLGSFSKRDVKYDSPQVDTMSGVTMVEGVDKAWFGLPDPRTLRLPGSSSGRYCQVMNEENRLISVMSVYRHNYRVISVGAYIVRRLCLEPPALLNDLHSIRARLSATPIVVVLLQALHEFQKECTLAAAILVALSNLSLTSVSARQIGEHGMPLIIRVMKRHRHIQKVVDYANCLLLNVCDGHTDFKRKLRDLEFPQFALKQIEKFLAPLKPNARKASASTPDMPSPTTSGSPAPSSKVLDTSAAPSNKKAKSQLLAALRPVLELYHAQSPISHLSSSSSFDQRSLTDSAPQLPGCGGNERALTSDSNSDVEDSLEAHVEPKDEERREEEADDIWTPVIGGSEETDERACSWILKRRSSLAFVQSVFCVEHRVSELVTIRKYLDVLSILGADYDMLRPETVAKCSSVIGDLIILLMGVPLPHVDLLLVSSCRCLLVMFEWGIQNENWSYCGPFGHSLLLLSELFVRARITLPYMTNCYLVIFSLLWKRWDHPNERKRFVDILGASLKLESLRRPPSSSLAEYGYSTASMSLHTSSSTSSSGTTPASLSSSAPIASPPSSPTGTSPGLGSPMSPSPSTMNTAPAPPNNLFLMTCAAMLGDFGIASYELRSHIRDSGVLQVLRSYREDAKGTVLDKLNDCLDVFEDNPLLRRGAQAQANRQEEAGEDVGEPAQEQGGHPVDAVPRRRRGRREERADNPL